MSAAILLREIQNEEISISVVNGSLKCKAKKPISKTLVASIQQHKADIIRLLSNQQPEKRIPVEKNLKPCPLCGGAEFIHGKRGGYFCITCQPNIEGQRVKAGGIRKKPTLQNCGISKPAPLLPKRKNRISTTATTWLQENKEELRSVGWTALELWRRNHPTGLAFFSIWEQPSLQAVIQPDDAIVFQYTNPTGQFITQSAIPRG